MSVPAAPAAATSVTTPAQQIIETPQQLVKNIDELAQKIKNARIAEKLCYLAVILPISFMAIPLCVVIGLGIVPTATAITAFVISVIAGKYAIFDFTPEYITSLENQLALYFNQMFSEDHGKLTSEHLQLLQKYAPLLDMPTCEKFAHNFMAGIERDKAFEMLTGAVKNEAVKQVILNTAKEFDANELIPLDGVSHLQRECKLFDDDCIRIEEAIKKGVGLKKKDGSLSTPEENKAFLNDNLAKLKEEIVESIKSSRGATDILVNPSDVAQVIKAMINIKKLKLSVATKEVFEALKDLKVKEIHLFRSAYSVNDVTHFPSTLKTLYWSNDKGEVKDIRPLAKRCPKLTKLVIRHVHSDAISDFSTFRNLKSLIIKGKDLKRAHGEAILKALPRLNYLKVDSDTLILECIKRSRL